MEDEYGSIKKILENKEKENETLRKQLNQMKINFQQDDDQINPIFNKKSKTNENQPSTKEEDKSIIIETSEITLIPFKNNSENISNFNEKNNQFNQGNLKPNLNNSALIKLSDNELDEYYKKFSHLYDETDKYKTQLFNKNNDSNFKRHSHITNNTNIDMPLKNSSKSISINLNNNNNNSICDNTKILDDNSQPYFPVVKNIQTNIEGIKSKLNNYENLYDSINFKIANDEKERIKQLTKQIEDLQKTLKEERSHKANLKALYQKDIENKELFFKKEKESFLSQFNEERENITKHQESLWKLKVDSLNKEIELKNKKIIELEKEIIILKKSNSKSDIAEYKRKYLQEMQELQATFEDFKIKAYNEFKHLKDQRDTEKNKVSELENILDKYRYESELNESNIKETENLFKSKTDNIKQLIKANELLKIDNENLKKDIQYLSHQVKSLKESEKKMQDIILENDFINDKLDDLGLNFQNISKCYSKTNLTEIDKNKSYSPIIRPRQNEVDSSFVNYDNRNIVAKSFIGKKNKNIFENIAEPLNKFESSSYTQNIKASGYSKKDLLTNQMYLSSNIKENKGNRSKVNELIMNSKLSSKQIPRFEPDLEFNKDERLRDHMEFQSDATNHSALNRFESPTFEFGSDNNEILSRSGNNWNKDRLSLNKIQSSENMMIKNTHSISRKNSKQIPVAKHSEKYREYLAEMPLQRKI